MICLVWSISVNHMINSKQKEMLLDQCFWKGHPFDKKNLILGIFRIISIYNFNEIYVDNPQAKLYQST